MRPRLFGIAYRMLGTVTEAEDLVQDVWVRWQTADRGAVVTPAASVNGRPGVVVRVRGRARAVIALALGPAGVTAVWLVLNPDKLGRWHGSV